MTAYADALDHHLRVVQDTQPIWHARAFCDRSAPWLEPALRDWLVALPEDAVEAIQTGRMPVEDWHPALRHLHSQVTALTDFPQSTTSRFDDAAINPRVGLHRLAHRFVDERKLRQLAAIAARTSSLLATLSSAHGQRTCAAKDRADHRIVDWCGGKGHLARAISLAYNVRATVVERNAEVIQSGAAQHLQAGLQTDWLQADVLRDTTASVLQRAHVAFALHACGELSATLLDHSTDSGLTHVVAIPCCPHMTGAHATWQPRSSIARASSLVLTTPDLKLAIADEVVAAPRHKNHRRQEQLWRLAADIALKDHTGNPAYHSAGPLPPSAFRGDLSAFLDAVFAQKGLPAPPHSNAPTYAVSAHHELRTVQALGVVRALFRRPIERLTLFDRAVAMQEHGWDVTLETLFAPSTSPRNTVLIASR